MGEEVVDEATGVKEIEGDLWDYQGKGDWVAVTTNGIVNKAGRCVMGRGVAQEATVIFPWLSSDLGYRIKRGGGNVVHAFPAIKLFSFPVKTHWRDDADLNLIERSAKQLREQVDDRGIKRVYLVQPGTGNGRRKWSEVKPLIEPFFDDRFVVVERRHES